ncbi:MAG TPA: chromate efflux transporter, partial [Streptosporangiaceae bacterium]|nr:chromate efflux transporter [Streptosporangiaceae bacterium]
MAQHSDEADQPQPETPQVSLLTIAREWGRIGCIGFGGPPAHIALLRTLCVVDKGWLPEHEFEDGVAACNLLPGPASTQLAIFCAWRLRGPAGALIGGLCFIVPGLVVILALSALFLAAHPPGWVNGAAAGAGAAVPAVAVGAAVSLLPGSWRRAGDRHAARVRWAGYLVLGGLAAATIGPWLVLVLGACGIAEVAVRSRSAPRGGRGEQQQQPPPAALVPLMVGVAARRLAVGAVTRRLAVGATARVVAGATAAGGLLALAWVAFKVGALSYGGGFVIIPLMQHDAVHTYHWMTAGQFLGAVALGQVTPGPVVQTVAVVGYAAAGLGGGLLAALVAFTPSFAFVLGGGRYFDRLRANARVQAFLTGAAPASIGAIAGAAIPLATSLAHLWQLGVLAIAAAWLLGLRRGVVSTVIGGA